MCLRMTKSQCWMLHFLIFLTGKKYWDIILFFWTTMLLTFFVPFKGWTDLAAINLFWLNELYKTAGNFVNPWCMNLNSKFWIKITHICSFLMWVIFQATHKESCFDLTLNSVVKMALVTYNVKFINIIKKLIEIKCKQLI